MFSLDLLQRLIQQGGLLGRGGHDFPPPRGGGGDPGRYVNDHNPYTVRPVDNPGDSAGPFGRMAFMMGARPNSLPAFQSPRIFGQGQFSVGPPIQSQPRPGIQPLPGGPQPMQQPPMGGGSIENRMNPQTIQQLLGLLGGPR